MDFYDQDPIYAEGLNVGSATSIYHIQIYLSAEDLEIIDFTVTANDLINAVRCGVIRHFPNSKIVCLQMAARRPARIVVTPSDKPGQEEERLARFVSKIIDNVHDDMFYRLYDEREAQNEARKEAQNQKN